MSIDQGTFTEHSEDTFSENSQNSVPSFDREQRTFGVSPEHSMAVIEQELNALKPIYFQHIQNIYINQEYNQRVRAFLSRFSEVELKKFFKHKILNIDESLLEYEYIYVLISQYLYFGTCPSILKNPHNQGFQLDYFIWVREDDFKANFPPANINISAENYDSFRQNHVHGWSRQQLLTFVNLNVVQPMFLTCNVPFRPIKENTKLHYYLDGIDDLFIRYERRFNVDVLQQFSYYFVHHLEQLFDERIIDFVKTYNCIEDIPNRNTLKVIKQKAKSLTDDSILQRLFYYLMVYIIVSKCRTKDKIDRAWKKLKDSIENKSNSKTRFKWQNLCKPSHFNRTFNIDELRELALDEGIPQHLFLTKQELCVEFAKRFENVLEGKKKIEPKCVNNTSITLTDIADIPAEFFYSYIHNNKVYCDDVRELYQHFKTNGNKHPIDRSPVSQALVNQVNGTYFMLEGITNTMEDLLSDDIPPISQTSLLSSKLAAFTSLLNYPSNIQNFTEANPETIRRFVDALIDEDLMSRGERAQLSVINDLSSYKIALLDMLTLKIRNDPETFVVGGNTLSTVAINMSNVWNSIF